MRAARLAPLVAALLALAGCWSVRAPGGAPDAGEGRDAGVDAGPTSDAGGDADIAGDAGKDGSIEDDAGRTSDGGEVDAGSDAGFDAGSDAGFDAGSDAGSDAGALDGGIPECRVLDPRAESCPGGGTGCARRVVVVPGARSFTIGRDTDIDFYGNRPVTVVPSLALAPFEIEVDEVTVARFRRWIVAGAPSMTVTLPDGTSIPTMSGTFETAAMNPDCTYGGTDDTLPMNCVSWDAALAFCSWDVPGGRLPTDVEREFVARWWNATPAETAGRMFPWGNDAPGSCTYANVRGCGRAERLLPVGSLATAFCLRDLAGNVAEWTIDDFGESDVASTRRPECWGAMPWTSPVCVYDNDMHTVRGGAWNDDSGPGWTRTSARGAINRFSTRPADGFRCARNTPMPGP
jgi:formylglycine-generating enzyme required for sulfatase activity